MIRLWGLWTAATLGLGAYGAMVVLDASQGTLRAGQTPTTITLYLIAFAGFLVAMWWNEAHTIPTFWFWGVPLLARVLLWFTEPTLSDDVYRYLWDGHLVTQGVNPYSYVISAPEVDQFEVAARTLANNPDLSSPYLPAAQFLFALVALVAPLVPTTMQVVMTAFDVGTAVLLYRLLLVAGLPSRRVLVYLWNPLVIVELAHGAHIDGFMVFLSVLSLWATVMLAPGGRSMDGSVSADHASWRRRARAAVAPVALALAVLTRPIPLLLAPVLWWRWTWVQRAAFVIVTGALLIPFGFGRAGWGLSEDRVGVGVFGSARVYSQDFRFNAIMSAWLERSLGGSADALSLVTAMIMAAVGLLVWLRARRVSGRGPADTAGAIRLMVVLVVAYVLFTPVLHPWYLVLLLALLPFVAPAEGESRWRWALLAPWLYLAAAIALSYLTYRNPDAFGELNWVRRVEWFPTMALLIAAAAAHRLRTKSVAKTPA